MYYNYFWKQLSRTKFFLNYFAVAGLNECFHDIDPDANFYDSLVHANDDISNEISVDDYNFLCALNEQCLSIIGHNASNFNANKDSLLGMFSKDHC